MGIQPSSIGLATKLSHGPCPGPYLSFWRDEQEVGTAGPQPLLLAPRGPIFKQNPLLVLLHIQLNGHIQSQPLGPWSKGESTLLRPSWTAPSKGRKLFSQPRMSSPGYLGPCLAPPSREALTKGPEERPKGRRGWDLQQPRTPSSTHQTGPAWTDYRL